MLRGSEFNQPDGVISDITQHCNALWKEELNLSSMGTLPRTRGWIQKTRGQPEITPQEVAAAVKNLMAGINFHIQTTRHTPFLITFPLTKSGMQDYGTGFNQEENKVALSIGIIMDGILHARRRDSKDHYKTIEQFLFAEASIAAANLTLARDNPGIPIESPLFAQLVQNFRSATVQEIRKNGDQYTTPIANESMRMR